MWPSQLWCVQYLLIGFFVCWEITQFWGNFFFFMIIQVIDADADAHMRNREYSVISIMCLRARCFFFLQSFHSKCHQHRTLQKWCSKKNNPKSNGFGIGRETARERESEAEKNANVKMYIDKNLLYCQPIPDTHSQVWIGHFNSTFFLLVGSLPAQCCAWKSKTTLLLK